MAKFIGAALSHQSSAAPTCSAGTTPRKSSQANEGDDTCRLSPDGLSRRQPSVARAESISTRSSTSVPDNPVTLLSRRSPAEAKELEHCPGISADSDGRMARTPSSALVNGEVDAGRTPLRPATAVLCRQNMKSVVFAVQAASVRFRSKICRSFGSTMSTCSSTGSFRSSGTPRLKRKKNLSPFSAEIAFDSGSTQYCIIKDTADPSMVYEDVVLPEWGLRKPRLILSIMGGAGNMQLDEDRFEASGFSKGLVEAALRTGAWVITGGTKSGVMDMVGKAMKQHDKQRRVACIGITPFWGLTTRWRDALRNGSYFGKVDAAEAKHNRDQPPETDGKIPLAEIQDNHTHFIMVDNNRKGGKAFGSESAFRAEFESYIASAKDQALLQGSGNRGRSAVDKEETWATVNGNLTGLHAPRVMILVNGGKNSLEALMAFIERGCPIVLCEGTGRLSDLLCEILRGVQRDTADRSINELFRRAKELHMKSEELTDEDRRMAMLIIQSGIVKIYSNSERLEDVILRAVLEGPSKEGIRRTVDIGRQVFLAVQWGCTDYFDMLGQQLLVECGAEHGGHSKAIEWVWWHIVRSGSSTNMMHRQVENKSCGVFVTWFLKNHRKQLMEFSVSPDNLGRIAWNHLAGGTTGLEGLLLWSIEQEAPASVLDAIWMHMDDPMHAALIAANALRETADLKHNSSSYNDVLIHKHLHSIADHFEKIAVFLLEDLAKTGKAVEYLFQDSSKWKSGGQHCSCFRLAHWLECKKVVVTTIYSQAVDLYWWTPAPFHVKKRQLNPKYFSLWKLPHLLINPEAADFTHWELLSIPGIKMRTHVAMKLMFVVIYSYAVFTGQLVYTGVQSIKVLLFIWGSGLTREEVRQFQDKNSFWDYIQDTWNFMDVTYISLMMGSLLLGVFLADGDPENTNVEHVLEVIHATCLLPCWLRALQPLQLFQYFGTLIRTILGMVKDAVKFFVVAGLVNFCALCALSPILFDDPSDREAEGMLWTLWMFVGDGTRLDKFRSMLRAEQSSFKRGLTELLLCALALLNVMLVNLLIAMMNSTYEKYQEASQTEWAFYRISAVMEVEDGQKLPPPLNLLEGFLLKDRTKEELHRAPHGFRRSKSLEFPVNKRNLKDSQQRAIIDIGLEEDLGEAAALRAENADFRKKNAELGVYIAELERLAVIYQ